MNDIRRKLMAYYSSLNQDDMKPIYYTSRTRFLNMEDYTGFDSGLDFFKKYLFLSYSSNKISLPMNATYYGVTVKNIPTSVFSQCSIQYSSFLSALKSSSYLVDPLDDATIGILILDTFASSFANGYGISFTVFWNDGSIIKYNYDKDGSTIKQYTFESDIIKQ